MSNSFSVWHDALWNSAEENARRIIDLEQQLNSTEFAYDHAQWRISSLEAANSTFTASNMRLQVPTTMS